MVKSKKQTNKKVLTKKAKKVTLKKAKTTKKVVMKKTKPVKKAVKKALPKKAVAKKKVAIKKVVPKKVVVKKVAPKKPAIKAIKKKIAKVEKEKIVVVKRIEIVKKKIATKEKVEKPKVESQVIPEETSSETTEMKLPYLNHDRIIATDEFIRANKFELRNEQEIIEKFKKEIQSANPFNFKPEVMLDYMSFENAKSFLKEDFVKEVEAGTKQYHHINTIKEAVQDFIDYMVFAWGKALHQRGLSAGRSVDKLSAWLWLLKRDDLADLIVREDLYKPYGSPALIKVCEALNINVPKELIDFSQRTDFAE